MKRFDITAMGELLIDFVPDGFDGDGDMCFVRKAGGAPLNYLATASKFGLKTAFIGKVGADLLGEFLIETVKKCGIDCRGLKTDFEHNTTLAFVELDKNGDRSFSFYRSHGADRFINKGDVDIELIANSKVFHFGSLSLTDEPSASATELAVKTAKENGCVVTYDPNYRAPLWQSEEKAVRQMSLLLDYVDIIKLSREELEMLGGISAIKARGVRLLLITDGENGAMTDFDGKSLHIPAANAKTVDTTGAGDIFFGSFVSELVKSGKALNKLDFEDAVKFAEKATLIAGKSTEKHGAIASIPEIL